MLPELQTPQNNAELAQIHYILDKSGEWQAPGKKALSFIASGELDKARQALGSHIQTLTDLQERLCAVIEEQIDVDIEAA